MSEQLEFVGIGGLAGDLVLQMDELPGRDDKYFVPPPQKVSGGFIANATVAAALLGLGTGYVGWIGEDDDGRWLEGEFLASGIGQEDLAMVRDPDIPTPLNLVMIDTQGNRAIIIPASPHYQGQLIEHQLTLIARSKVAYSYARDMQWIKDMARAVHSGGGVLVIDSEATFGLSRSEFDEVAALTDTLFISQDVITAFGYDSLESIPVRGWIIQTSGSQGAYGYDVEMGIHVQQSAFKVDAVDTTGAGDCYHAAVVLGRIRGWSLQESLRFASGAAAIKVQHIGARGGLPTYDEVMQFLAEKS